MVTVVITIVIITALISTYQRPDWFENKVFQFNRKTAKFILRASILVWVLGWLFLVAYYLKLIPRYYEALATRAIIFDFLIAILGSITALSMIIWQGALLQPMQHYTQRIRTFFALHPAYYFIVISLSFLTAAQVIDLTISEFAYDYIVEEVFELEASIGLLFATLAIKNTNPHS